MTPNPLLKKLGYSDNDRLVIIHADDVGMCHASIQAYKDLWDFGTISSGSAMVPCAWFPSVAEMCRDNPKMDMGVHATLNSEWDSYRWSPLSTRDQDSGLVDKQGYFHQQRDPVYEQASPEAVAIEVNMQVERAFAAGIDVTHVDSHMGTITDTKFVQSYMQAAVSRMLPNMLPRASAQGFTTMGIKEDVLTSIAPLLQQIESLGVPMVDGMFAMPLYDEKDHVAVAKELLSEVPAGITHFILHPSVDTPELRAICSDWPSRVANYNAFMSRELRDFITNSDIQLIGYRQIRDAMRQL
jgi:chitin disaccharide deacetylase